MADNSKLLEARITW